jgi:uncharacterized protein YndB with AHSA1/START domain
VTDTTTAETQEVQLETLIDASPDAVWKALTDDIGQWWPAEFYIGGAPGRRSFHLEAEPGGRVYEIWEDGGGLQWGQVWHVNPGKTLQFSGAMFPEWGGPSLTFGTWTLTPEGDGCKLHFTESTLGKTPDYYLGEKEKGWKFLLEGVLKSYLEGTTPPAWEG